MEGVWLAAGHLAAALLMVILAALLLWLDAASRPVRAFVAFLVLRAGSLVIAGIAPFAAVETATALGTMAIDLHIAIAGAIAWLASVYPRRAPAWLRVAILVATLGALGTFLFARCLVVCAESGAGPLALLARVFPVAMAAGSVYLFVASRDLAEGTRRTSARIIATGLAVESALAGGTALQLLLDPPSPPVLAVILVISLLPIVVASWTLSASGRLAALLLLVGAFATAYLAVGRGDIATLVVGVWRLVVPLLVAYALARHRLFDLDVKVRLATKHATIGAVFAGAFFVATEGAAYLLGTKFGVFAGILAVGALVPLMGRLRLAAERVADLLPGEDAAPRDLPIERRRQIYHEFAVQAWGDGSMARDERLFLDQLRERLALSADDALRLETEASLSIQRTG